MAGPELDIENNDKPESRWIWASLTACAVGFITVFCLGLTNPPVNSGKAVFSGILLAGASLIVGGFFGFLFGIPRSRQIDTSMLQAAGHLDRSYGENTNLEQISDWLTKIIVGITLVQFESIKALILNIGNTYGPVFVSKDGAATGGPIAVAILLYFFVLGFLFLYLWTRIYMAWLLKRQHAIGEREVKKIVGDEVAAKLNSMDSKDASTLQLVEDYLDPDLQSEAQKSQEVSDEVRKRIRDASLAARRSIFLEARKTRRLHWKNDDTDVIERVANVFRGLIDAAPESYFKNYAQLAYALIRQSKPQWSAAKTALEMAIKLRDKGRPRSNRYYEYHLGLCLIHLDSNFHNEQASDQGAREDIVRNLKIGLEKIKIGDSEDQDVIRQWNQYNNNPLKLDNN